MTDDGERASDLPIGVFDSGIGGPPRRQGHDRRHAHEDLIYLGDTARVPYGTRSPATVIPVRPRLRALPLGPWAQDARGGLQHRCRPSRSTCSASSSTCPSSA